MTGGGKYHTLAEAVTRATEAEMVLLVVCGGNKGSGFDLATVDAEYARQIVPILREIADKLEANGHVEQDIKEVKQLKRQGNG